MKHWHWSRRSKRAVSHKHKGGEKDHRHLERGWLCYGRKKETVLKMMRLTEKV